VSEKVECNSSENTCTECHLTPSCARPIQFSEMMKYLYPTGPSPETVIKNDDFKTEYDNYTTALTSGRISINGLERIIKHDNASGWCLSPKGLARIRALQDCTIFNIIHAKKNACEQGDELYGVDWPLPLFFDGENDEKCGCEYCMLEHKNY